MALTHARLLELLNYDPQTGVFTWKTQRWGGPRQGTPAGTLGGNGYWKISLDGKQYSAHRLAFFYVHGRWPHVLVDHKDRNKLNNRMGNLEETGHIGNARNRTPKVGRTSGVRRREPDHRYRKVRWEVTIGTGGHQRYLGTFHSEAEAIEARKKAEKEYAYVG